MSRFRSSVSRARKRRSGRSRGSGYDCELGGRGRSKGGADTWLIVTAVLLVLAVVAAGGIWAFLHFRKTETRSDSQGSDHSVLSQDEVSGSDSENLKKLTEKLRKKIEALEKQNKEMEEKTEENEKKFLEEKKQFEETLKLIKEDQANGVKAKDTWLACIKRHPIKTTLAVGAATAAVAYVGPAVAVGYAGAAVSKTGAALGYVGNAISSAGSGVGTAASGIAGGAKWLWGFTPWG